MRTLFPLFIPMYQTSPKSILNIENNKIKIYEKKIIENNNRYRNYKR